MTPILVTNLSSVYRRRMSIEEVNDSTQKAELHRTDIMTKEARSRLMSAIGTRNTKPELAVRSVLRSLGHQYRLYGQGIAGKPDIILSRVHTLIFVHGCFWHQHPGCRKATIPKQNAAFWRRKLRANRDRDHSIEKELRKVGWRVIVVWECQTRNRAQLISKLSRRLNSSVRSTRL